jgi:predicted kinase
VLIILSGLPGVGKTTIARELARQIGAAHIRIDTIELALREAGRGGDSLDDLGYRIAYAVAEDNLRLGQTVIADSVNPWPITRDAWRDVANRAQARLLEVEVVCSDQAEHRRRVESRPPEPFGPRLTWQDVVARDYRRWDRERVVIDTALGSVEGHVQQLRAAMARADAMLQNPPACG